MSALVNPASYPHTSLFFGPSKAQSADTCIYSGEGRMAQQTNNAVIDSMTTLSGVFPPESFQSSCLLSRKYDYSTTIEIVRFPYHTIHTLLSSAFEVLGPDSRTPATIGQRPWHCWNSSNATLSCSIGIPLYILPVVHAAQSVVDSSRVCAFGNHTEVGRQRECVGNTRSCRAGQ